MAKRY